MSDEKLQKEVEEVIRRTLSIEEDNLHYKRPPSIIQDLKGVVEEEVNEIEEEGEK